MLCPGKEALAGSPREGLPSGGAVSVLPSTRRGSGDRDSRPNSGASPRCTAEDQDGSGHRDSRARRQSGTPRVWGLAAVVKKMMENN